MEDQSEHSHAHGRLVLKAMLAHKHLGKAKEAISDGGEREVVSAQGLFLIKNFEMAARSENDVWLVREIPATSESALANFTPPAQKIG